MTILTSEILQSAPNNPKLNSKNQTCKVPYIWSSRSPNADHYPASEPDSLSLTSKCRSQSSRTSNFNVFVLRGRESNHQPPACRAKALPLHYPAAVIWARCYIIKFTTRSHATFRVYLMLFLCTFNVLRYIFSSSVSFV